MQPPRRSCDRRCVQPGLATAAAYRPALRQLDLFSHVIVLWWANYVADEESRQVLQCNPPYAEDQLTGVFATRAIWDIGEGAPLGLIEGGNVIVGQIAAVAVSWVLAVVVTFILLKVLDATMGLRVAPEAEIEGLDLSQHGEEGYIFI